MTGEAGSLIAWLIASGIVSGALAFGGAWIGVRKDITHHREWLQRHDREHELLHQRIDRTRDA